MQNLAVSGVSADDLAQLKKKRDRKGSDWCLEKGVGAELRRRALCENVLPFRRVQSAERHIKAARDIASAALGAVCRDCPLTCVLARRG